MPVEIETFKLNRADSIDKTCLQFFQNICYGSLLLGANDCDPAPSNSIFASHLVELGTLEHERVNELTSL